MDYNYDACLNRFSQSQNKIMKSDELFIDTNKKSPFKNILIVGLGKSGISSAQYLAKFKNFFGCF